MQAVRAGLLGVLIDHVPRHLADVARGVVEGPRVDVHEVGLDDLVGDDVPVRGDRQLAGLEPAVEVLHGAPAGVQEHVVQEVGHRLERLTGLHHLDDPLDQVVVQRLTPESDVAVVDGDLAELAEQVPERQGDVGDLGDLGLVAGEDGADQTVVGRLVVGEGERTAVGLEDSHAVHTLNVERDHFIVSLMSFSCSGL